MRSWGVFQRVFHGKREPDASLTAFFTPNPRKNYNGELDGQRTKHLYFPEAPLSRECLVPLGRAS